MILQIPACYVDTISMYMLVLGAHDLQIAKISDLIHVRLLEGINMNN